MVSQNRRGPPPKYCSRICIDRHHHPLSKTVKAKCIVCFSEFLKKSGKTKYRFCSAKCRNKFSWRKNRKPNLRNCRWCQKEFDSKRTLRDFCSWVCRDAKKKSDKKISDSRSNHRRRQRMENKFFFMLDKNEIFKRDKFICAMCKRKCLRNVKWPHPRYPTIDHIIPLSKNGLHVIQNLRTLCWACNMQKRATLVPYQMDMLDYLESEDAGTATNA